MPIGANRVSRNGNVGAAIPDRGDLHARYDFTQEDGSLPITDQTGNGHDLDSGQYSGVSASINGVQAGSFDGNDDRVTGDLGTLSEPFTIYFVFRVDSADSLENFYADNTADRYTLFADTGPDVYEMFSGARIGGNTTVTGGDIVVIGSLWDDANSVMRINESQDATGDTGDSGSSMAELVIGDGDSSSSGREADITAGEMLIYPSDKLSIASEIETYLTGKWGPVGLA